ncbi:hypothetical protein AB7148_06025 [Providencia rettgeri]
MISGRLISKEYKTSAELDSFLIGYNENTYLDSLNDNYKYGDGDEEILDKSARESITSVKYLHSRLINAIDVNTENLNKLNFTQSSIFAIPSPNVPTLPHGVGSNSQVTQTADSSIAKGIEKALGNIRDGLAETFDCSFGMSCSNDIDKAANNSNVEKFHTGGDQIPEQGRTDTSGNQIPEHIDNTHITPLPNQITVEDIAYLSENKNNIKNKWHQGSFNSPDESLQKHYEKHGKEVGAGSVEQYRNKAEEFVKNLKGARTVKVRGATNNVTRYYKNGKYLDRTSEGKIISFGKL